MYKLIVSRFERALIDREEAISASTVTEIDNIRRKGVLFAVFTDGSFKDILDYNVDFPFLDYIIAYGGVYLYDVVHHKTIYKKKLTKTTIRTIIRYFSDYNIYAFTDNQKILIKDLDDKNIYKLEIECPSKRVLNDIEKKLDGLKLNIRCDFKKCDGHYILEIITNCISTSMAIEKICDIKKIKLEDVVGIGVDDRDISLLKKVGYKVAMGNATAHLKKEAEVITKSNDNSGVREILSKLEF